MYVRHTLIVDASYDHRRDVMGVGIAVHEADRPGRNGVLIDQIGEAYSGIPDGVGELLAVHRALEIARARGFAVVRVRSDYNQMRKTLKRDHDSRTGCDRGDLHGSILQLADEFESVEFAYKPKRKNRMAHELARCAAKEMAPIHRSDLVAITQSRRDLGQQDACTVRR
jgi:ribonuclease HI